MKVKRYDSHNDGSMWPVDDGGYVKYEDYAALLKERDALATDNELLKDSVEHAAGCIHAAEAEGLVDALSERDGERLADLIHRRLCHAYLEVETPATDAAIANIQAQGVDKYAEMFKLMADMNIKHNQEFITLTEWYAKQLRNGAIHD